MKFPDVSPEEIIHAFFSSLLLDPVTSTILVNTASTHTQTFFGVGTKFFDCQFWFAWTNLTNFFFDRTRLV